MFVEHKEVGEVAKAPAKITKLSEAIRIGARLRPQCTAVFFSDGASCAIGAAMEATGIAYGDTPNTGELHKLFPALDEFAMSIYAKNDDGWTREQIADWLEKQGL